MRQQWAINLSINKFRVQSKIQEHLVAGSVNVLKFQDRVREYEQLVQLSSPLSLSLPEA